MLVNTCLSLNRPISGTSGFFVGFEASGIWSLESVPPTNQTMTWLSATTKVFRWHGRLNKSFLDLIDKECLIAMTAICELDESYLSREPKAAVISGEAG